MKEFRPKRRILYVPFVIGVCFFAACQSLLDLDIVSSGTFADRWGHAFLLGAVIFSGLWGIEGFHFFNCRGLRLTVDEGGFRVNLRGTITQRSWDEVENVQIRPLGLLIHLPDQRRPLEFPLIPRRQQRYAYRLWFEVRGLRPDETSYLNRFSQ